MIQQLPETATIICAPRLLSIDRIQRLVPKQRKRIQQAHRYRQRRAQRETILNQVQERQNREDHAAARY